jgi:hypothetical protein
MADFGSPPTANYTPPDGLATLGNMMSLKAKKQSIESQQLQMEGQRSTNQILAGQAVNTQQDAKETQAGAQLMSDPVGNGLTDEEGKPTKDAYTIIKRSMPMTGDKHYSDLLAAASGNVQYKNSWLKLRGDVRQDVSSRLAGVAADPANGLPEIQDAIDNLKKDYADTPAASDVNTIADVSKQAVDKAGNKHGIQGAKQVIMGFSRGGLGNAGVTGPGGVAAPTNGSIDTGGQIQPVVQAPALAGGGVTSAGPPIAKVTPPANVAGPNGQIVHVPTGGAGLPTLGGGGPTAPAGSPQPRTAVDDAPPPNAPRAVQENFQRSATEAQQHVSDVRKADADYGNNVAISNTIRHLSDSTDTGPGTKIWHTAMAGLGVDSGANYQELGAFLDRQAAGLRTQMGLPGTNAGAEESKAISGNTEYSRKALQDKNDYTQSLVEGAHQYRHGLDRIEGFSGQASPKAVQAYRSAWADNFDPNVYKLDIMKQQGPAKLKEFINSLDPKEAASLSMKRKNLQALSNGQVPQ